MNATAPGSTILVIEDDEHIATVIEFMLQREGLVAERLADGRAATARIVAGPVPALVLMDIMLPYRDGYELVVQLRQQPGWERVPVIMLSAKSQEKDIVRALESGANDHIVKPFQPRELMARIQRLLRATG